MKIHNDKDFETLWLERKNLSINNYTFLCLELANDVSRWLKQKHVEHHIAYIENVYNDNLFATYFNNEWVWKYHAIIMSKGFVHDAWFGKPLMLSTYIKDIFQKQDLRITHYGKKEKEELWKNGQKNYKRTYNYVNSFL
jgi:hypothetical protein